MYMQLQMCIYTCWVIAHESLLSSIESMDNIFMDKIFMLCPCTACVDITALQHRVDGQRRVLA